MRAKNLTKETILNIGVEGKRDFDSFCVGDTIAVSQTVIEGTKERVQIFEGDVIAQKRNGISSTFTIRKLSTHGIFVERIYPYYSPIIKKIVRLKTGRVRRAKLFYLRDRIGKKARIKEKVLTHDQKVALSKKKEKK